MMKKRTRYEHGFVSILTVLFFMTLVSVVTVGFARIMIQERQQEMEDELTKSAYNAALAGVEDAKQVIRYCSRFASSDPQRAACEAKLYEPACPGFNKESYGMLPNSPAIPQSINGKTSVSGEGDVEKAPQGYSCVIVRKVTPNLEGTLRASTASGAMHELKTDSSYDTLSLYWDRGADGVTNPDSAGQFSTGNARLDGYGNKPAVIRVTVIAVPNASFNLDTIRQSSTFLYPVAGQSSTAVDINVARNKAQCSTLPEYDTGYRCRADINVSDNSGTQTNYIVLNALYKDAVQYKLVARQGAGDVNFNGVQPSIDATGYTSGVSRRVVARVHIGGVSINTPNAIDTGLGLCKDFRVGAELYEFNDAAAGYCRFN